MELINGVNVFLLLALSSLFFTANAICVPRNSSDFEYPLASTQASSPQSSSPPSQSTPAPTDNKDSELNVQESQSDSVSSSESESPVDSLVPPQEPSPQSPSTPAPTDSEDSGESSQKSHSDTVPSSEATTPTDLVEICDVTSNPQLCTKSIASNMDESTVDPTSALKTEIEQSIKEVEKAVTKLKSLRKDSGASEAEIQCYETCLENFDMAIFDLKSGLDAIDAKDAGTMESVLAAVSSDLMTCDDTFMEMGVDSPLDNLSSKMSKYASNCLAISKLLL